LLGISFSTSVPHYLAQMARFTCSSEHVMLKVCASRKTPARRAVGAGAATATVEHARGGELWCAAVGMCLFDLGLFLFVAAAAAVLAQTALAIDLQLHSLVALQLDEIICAFRKLGRGAAAIHAAQQLASLYC
jgi:hypothetical protein